MKAPKAAPKAAPNAPMKFKPIPALNNAVVASQLALRLEASEAEVQRLRSLFREMTSDLSHALGQLDGLAEALVGAGQPDFIVQKCRDDVREAWRVERRMQLAVQVDEEMNEETLKD